MSSLSISITLLPVLVPGLDEVHCPGPAVAAEDGELTSDETHAWHHPATPAVQIVKLREREGQRVDLGRSLKGHL